MTQLAASFFFTFALLAAAVTTHLTVRAYWAEILLALKGEWEGTGAVRPKAVRLRARAVAARPKPAAF